MSTKKQYRTAKPASKTKPPKLKYPLQPVDAVDKFEVGSWLGDYRLWIDEIKDKTDRADYIINNHWKYQWEEGEFEALKADRDSMLAEVARLTEALERQQTLFDFLMAWEEALDCVKRGYEQGKIWQIAGDDMISLIAEGKFEADRFNRAIQSGLCTEFKPLRELQDGEYWVLKCDLSQVVQDWLGRIPNAQSELIALAAHQKFIADNAALPAQATPAKGLSYNQAVDVLLHFVDEGDAYSTGSLQPNTVRFVVGSTASKDQIVQALKALPPSNTWQTWEARHKKGVWHIEVELDSNTRARLGQLVLLG